MQRIRITQRTILIGLLILILGIGWSLRWLSLESIPSSFTPDELVYLVQAKSLLASGSDLSGTWNPVSLRPFHAWYGELSSHVIAVGMLFAPNNPVLGAHISYVVLGCLLPLLITSISYSLFKNKWLSVAVLFVAMFNPVLFQFSRLVYDSFPSLFFYTLGIALYLYPHNKVRLFSILAFSFGFFHYQGYKLLLLPIVVLLTSYTALCRPPNKFTLSSLSSRYRTELLLLGVTILIYACYLLVLLPGEGASVRMTESVGLQANLGDAQNATDSLRRSLLDAPTNVVFINKYTLLVQNMMYRYIGSFDLRDWFVGTSDTTNYFTVWQHGYFYVFDILFLAAGIFFLIKKYEKQGLLLLGFALIAPIPEAIQRQVFFWPDTHPFSQYWPLFRSSLLILVLILVIGVGLYHMLDWIRSKNTRLFLPAVTAALCVYFICIAQFMTYYFYVFPISGSKENLQLRTITNYIERVPSGTPITVYTDYKHNFFERYLFYSNQITPQNTETIRTAVAAFDNEQFTWNNITFSSSCAKAANTPSEVIIIESGVNPCEGEPDHTVQSISVASPIDSGGKFYILNDPVCTEFTLPAYIRNDHNKFSQESLSDKDFCEEFLVKYSNQIGETP